MLLNKYTLTALAGAVASVSGQAKFNFGSASASAPGVVAQNPNGPTNPKSPQLNTPINQTSEARLVTVNSVDDWCTFSSPNGDIIANVEGETVAYCTKARNNARVIVSSFSIALFFRWLLTCPLCAFYSLMVL